MHFKFENFNEFSVQEISMYFNKFQMHSSLKALKLLHVFNLLQVLKFSVYLNLRIINVFQIS